MQNERKAYEEWLKRLEPGDEVFVYSGGFINYYTLQRVEKITPTGMIRLADGSIFNSDGRERTTSMTRGGLYEPTQKLRDQERRKDLISEVRASKFSVLTLDQLERIMAIIQEGE